MSYEDIDRIGVLYRACSYFQEDDRNQFINELDGVDSGIIKELLSAEKRFGKDSRRNLEKSIKKRIENPSVGYFLAELRLIRFMLGIDNEAYL